jgi:CRISPR-associated endonuclease/helicase Cas3
MNKTKNKFLAHRTDDGREQSIMEHVKGTAQLASNFASEFDCEILAAQMGMGHDIGKYSKQFQNRILNNGKKVDHATAGGIEMYNIYSKLGLLLAYGIMGHHGGMPDGGNRVDTASDITLLGRLKRKPGEHICDYLAYADEIQFSQTLAIPDMLKKKVPDGFTISFLIRMLFSCLVDADYLDTENFMLEGTIKRGGYDSMKVLLEKLTNDIVNKQKNQWNNPSSEITKMRYNILNNCIEKAKNNKGIFTLTVPTGGGKTISSLAFALHHAVHQKSIKRIIYIIPFTSIIEQNAGVFENILGAENVVAHHSNISYDSDDKSEKEEDGLTDALKRKRLATENWDAPIIVSTNVQFFESLFSNRTGKCRKLHNLTNSIIIFDEAQMLPLKYLKPCMRAITELVENYHCTVVLCTATQPALEKFIPPTLKIKEICENTNKLYEFFKRITAKDLGNQDDEQLVNRLLQHKQTLCIVNSRKQAQHLYEKLGESEENYHLSTYMTPTHRKYILKIVRARLTACEPCRLIATSLVEAGVDVDFPCVYRARAGLDSIIQAAGRGNREGKNAAAESFVYIFDAEQKYSDNYPAFIKTGTSIAAEIALSYDDIMSPAAIQSYFNILHRISDEELDEKEILPKLERDKGRFSFPFKQIASEFRLIDQNTKMLLIPNERLEDEMEQDSNSNDKARIIAEKLRNGEMSRTLLRTAGLHSVNVYDHQFNELYRSGQIELVDEEIAILRDEKLYHKRMGLRIIVTEGTGWFL